MRTIAILLAAAAPLLMATLASAADIQLSSPIACPTGMVCPVQNLFDHDPGPEMRDYRCQALGYDGHDGTDIRIPNLTALQTGVEVKAAADGLVLGLRDGMADVGIAGAGGKEALKGVECGNGVTLGHSDGWQTQYCHMAKGSIAVKKGDQVKRGQTLGKVGMSGMAEFPHLHFALRLNMKPVDPFALDGPTATCGPTRSAWTTEAQAALQPQTPTILNAGFADRPVPPDDIETDAVSQRPPGRDPQALVVYGRVIGLLAGDGVSVVLTAPNGAQLARNDIPPMAKPRAQQTAFGGIKRPAAGWPKGFYKGQVVVTRDGKPFKQTEFQLDFGS